nr:synaptophysin-like [Onthophagus taurus]
MDLNLSVFQEPRGVMRIFHFVFAIVAFATTVDFSKSIMVNCDGNENEFIIDYPFDVTEEKFFANCTVTLYGNFSSDAKFYVCTGVLSMLYAAAILVIYTKFDQMYRDNENLPLIDFILSVILSIFWLSSSAAWANGLSGLKSAVGNLNIMEGCHCTSSGIGFSSLNISIVVGFLNFFLWASNLWFLYKETKWFQKPVPSSPAI